MAERICTTADCDKPSWARGLCNTCYARWRRANREAVNHFRTTCQIDGCDGKHFGKGWCYRHYNRVWRTGSPERTLIAEGTSAGSYKKARTPGHPVAGPSGITYVHRVALYDAIGSGAHACHWCGTPVHWMPDDCEPLVVDHLDLDKSNNDPANLVPACRSCNAARVPSVERQTSSSAA